MLIKNPAPKGFISTASRDIYSDNTGQDITTEKINESAKQVHNIFQKKGYYSAIKESQLFTKGNSDGE